MRSLYLVRHASASIDSPTRKDIDRALNHDGIAEAEIMAKYLRKQSAQINLIVSSTALRAYTTSIIFAKHFFYPIPEIRKEESIFLNNSQKDFSLLSSMDDIIENILFVGHNPSITLLANSLSDKSMSSFKPAGIACIEFEIEKWELLSQKGVLKFYADPKLVM